jgi:hypothetical protein
MTRSAADPDISVRSVSRFTRSIAVSKAWMAKAHNQKRIIRDSGCGTNAAHEPWPVMPRATPCDADALSLGA